MNIVFRVDSSSQMGVGHLMRCLTLANKLTQHGYDIFFVCRDLEGNLISLIKYPAYILSKNNNFNSDDLYLNWLGATQEQDAEQTIKAVSEDIDILLVDSYALDEEWHKQLRPHTKKIMVIDDLADRQFDCDILLNQNLGIHRRDYRGKVPNDCELLLGCNYALLRPEFAELRVQALEKRQNTTEIKNILISMGGSDIKNITYDVLQKLDDKFNVIAVLGGSSPHNKMIKNYAKGKNIEVIINANNMSELMLETDLAIGAGGSTSWERCCLGLPVLLYILSENQREIAENLEQSGAAQIVNNLRDNLQVVMADFDLWRAMSNKSKNICDGLGAERIESYLGNL